MREIAEKQLLSKRFADARPGSTGKCRGSRKASEREELSALLQLSPSALMWSQHCVEAEAHSCLIQMGLLGP